METVGEIIRRMEDDFVSGTTQISKYVTFSLNETLEKIDAYANSKHVSGQYDSQGRKKPFFNIVTAAINVWYRAIDLDRKDVRVRANQAKNWLNSLLATALLRDWMRKENIGAFLNEWGRTKAKYGSAAVKIVENSSGLHIRVVPWNTLICDAVDFENNPKIEVLELTEAQLYDRVKTHGYDKSAVEELCSAKKARETRDGQRKDNKANYYKLYEIHLRGEKELLTGKEEDEEMIYQMHVVSYVSKKNGRKTEYQDFTLVKGEEKEDPYLLTHIAKEDGRILAIGAVERLFEAQWMTNHSMKSIKDTLDIASRLIFQTSNAQLLGQNVLSNVESGDILVHPLNQPLTKLDNSKQDIVGWQNYAIAWKQAGSEAAGISEAMLGATPKSGTAWRQTEAVLQESYSLFELFRENAGLEFEFMLRTRILPYFKKKMLNNSDEIVALLTKNEIDRVDAKYLKAETSKRQSKYIMDKIFKQDLFDPNGNPTITPESLQQNETKIGADIQGEISAMGSERFFKPSEISDKTWKEQLKDLEWELEVDVTGEEHNITEALTTLNTALRLVVTPGFDQNTKAQAIVGRILEMTGAMSPLEYASIPAPKIQPVAPSPVGALPNQDTQLGVPNQQNA